MKKQVLAVIISLIAISFIFGLVTGTYKTFPYYSLDYVKKIALSEPEIEIETISSHIYEVDVHSLIKIKNEGDIFQKRNSVIEYIWSGIGFPKELPEIEENITDPAYDNLVNLERIDKIVVNMDYGINSIAYHFIPEKKINKLIIYHQGHGGDFTNGKDAIQFFLENGYSILAFTMPLLGMNNQPIVEVNNLGPIILKSHNHFQFLEADDIKPVKFFVEPIAKSLNYIEDNYNYESFHMLGISGGGWATVLYPAIDTRINQSYSVAGSYPLFIQSGFKKLGDYETNLPELYNRANYLELYIMAGYGDNRKFIQIFNEFDPCCWSGDYFKVYEDEVKNVMDKLNYGKFDIWLDSTHKEHIISPYALELILESMENS